MSLLSGWSSGSYCRVQSPPHLLGWDGALAHDTRFRAREIHDGGRRARQLAAVDDGGGAFPDVPGDFVEPPRIRAARMVGTGGDHGSNPFEHVAAGRVQLRNADTDSFGVRSGQPAM